LKRINAIRWCSVAVPLRAPVSMAGREVSERHYGLVVVEAGGEEGIGFSYLGNRGGAIFSEVMGQLLAPLAVGEDVYGVEGIWSKLYRDTLLNGRMGIVMRAMSALDIALWDRNARAAGLPLFRYLGACRQDAVPAYVSGGYYGPGENLESLSAEMRGYVDAGFRAMKIKVGRFSDPGREEERVAAAREAIGPDRLLMLDANNAWPDVVTALEFLRRFEKYTPHFIEEPFSPDDIESHVRLAHSSPIPVSVGELESGRWRFAQWLDSGAIAVLQADAAVCGGITEFRRIAAAAASYGVPVYPHWFHEMHVHLAASTPNVRMVEYLPDDAILNFRMLADGRFELRDGCLVVPDRLGLGFNFDDEAAVRYAISPWARLEKQP
jgi:L-alanine-DL-glutamate epimerase-like enolase superfamily enzyme